MSFGGIERVGALVASWFSETVKPEVADGPGDEEEEQEPAEDLANGGGAEADAAAGADGGFGADGFLAAWALAQTHGIVLLDFLDGWHYP